MKYWLFFLFIVFILQDSSDWQSIGLGHVVWGVLILIIINSFVNIKDDKKDV